MQMAGGMKMGCRSLRVLPWLLLAWLASCGGGTQQIEPFQAQRVIFIGDETVGLLPDGRRYGINVINADSNFDCAQLPIWSQQLAANFGFPTDYCGGGTRAVTRAVAHAKAADVEGQITDQIAEQRRDAEGFVRLDGGDERHHRAVRDSSPGRQENCDTGVRDPAPGTLMAELQARGRLVAAQINRLIEADGRLIVSTVHDIGYTPYAIAAWSNGAAVVHDGGVQRARARRSHPGRPLLGPGAGRRRHAGDRAQPGHHRRDQRHRCRLHFVAPPACTTATLVNPQATSYLWATDRHFGPLMHNQLASEAITRARNNPF